MKFYDPERLKTAPLSSIPFAMYQLEEDDKDILLNYCKALQNEPTRRSVAADVPHNSEELYIATADITNTIGCYVMPSMKDIAGQIPPNYRWGIRDTYLQCKKKGEFVPPFSSGYSDFSFACIVNVPFDVEEEMAMPHCKDVSNPSASKFQLIYPSPLSKVSFQDFVFSKSDEGMIIVYPSAVNAQVFPFATTEEDQYIVWGSVVAQEGTL